MTSEWNGGKLPRVALSALCALILALAPVPAATAPAGAAEPTIKVMTYNIRYLNTSDGEDVWANRREALCETIAAADIVGLQEVVVQQFDDVQRATPELEWYGAGRDDGQRGGEMCSIGWRKDRFSASDRGTFWLSESPEAAGVRGWDAALPRVVSWVALEERATGTKLLMVNTHFDHRGPKAREESGRLVRRWIAEHRGDRPALLTGDLNAQLDGAPLRALLDDAATAGVTTPPMIDTRAVTKQADTGPSGTFNSFKKIAEGRRIDHVLFQGKVQVDRVTTLDPKTAAGRFASDHQPILVEVRL